MRSVRFTRTGPPSEVLEILELPTPEPGPGELRVRLTARPINPSDLLFVEGLYGQKPVLPSVVGFEGAGTVDAAGPETRLPPGTRVIVPTLGTWQDYVIIPEQQVIPTPDGLSDDIACQFVVNPLTAWLLIDELHLEPGQWLLQTAGASALGQMVVQIARLRGIKTISTVRRDDQVAALQALGADVVVQTEREDLEQRVKELTGGRGVPGAIDAVGGRLGAQLVSSLGRNGTLLIYGLLSLEPIPLDSGLMIFRSLNVKGFWLSDWMRTAPAARRAEVFQEMLELLASGQVTPPIEARYDLSEVRQAALHAARPGRLGKILLVS